jgi:hypothetical protein
MDEAPIEHMYALFSKNDLQVISTRCDVKCLSDMINYINSYEKKINIRGDRLDQRYKLLRTWIIGEIRSRP